MNGAVDPHIEEGSFRSLGFGRLRRVEEKILRYEAGEVAHIENVLKGEHRTRDHRRLRRTEEILRVEEERTEETEKDLQSTDRFEIQKENEEKVSEESSLDVGVTLSYGGFIDVEASTQYSRRDASERSERTAVNYAHEVIEKTVSKIQERVREERVRTTIEEFEEKNIHIVDNKDGSGHVVGIYRWVDKVYEAQVFDYGWRLLFEFLIPEPAALLRHSLEQQADEELKEPVPPQVLEWQPLESGFEWRPLKPKHLQPSDYQNFLPIYNVQNVKPPPEMYTWEVYTFKAPQAKEYPSGKPAREAQTKKIDIPTGYKAKSALITARLPEDRIPSSIYLSGFSAYVVSEDYVAVTIGDQTRYFGRSPFTKAENVDLSPREAYTGEIAAMIETAWSTNWAVSIEILYERTDDALSKWRQETYDAIMQAYLQQKAEYEEHRRARAVQEGIAISGRNPALNREVERTELKRGALTLLTQRWHPQLADFGSIGTDTVRRPVIDFAEAKREAPEIQFLEQAFEWHHMMYSFYPYYWTNRDSWPLLQQIADNDPLHARFLAAGAARVIVPVRPGYAKWLFHYLVTGVIYRGGDPPRVTDARFVSIISELTELQGYDGTPREGTVRVENGSKDVFGTGTAFVKPEDCPIENDENKRIYIDRKPYHIARVVSGIRIVLSEEYRGETKSGLPYAIGAKFVGAPWEVRVPTSLVILEKRTDNVDDLTFGESE